MSRLERLRKLAATQPNDPFVHYGVGLECVAQEQWDEALAAFERTLAIDGAYSAAHMQKARVEVKLGQRDAARATLVAGIAAAQAAGESHAAGEMGKILETLG